MSRPTITLQLVEALRAVYPLVTFSGNQDDVLRKEKQMQAARSALARFDHATGIDATYSSGQLWVLTFKAEGLDHSIDWYFDSAQQARDAYALALASPGMEYARLRQDLWTEAFEFEQWLIGEGIEPKTAPAPYTGPMDAEAEAADMDHLHK